MFALVYPLQETGLWFIVDSTENYFNKSIIYIKILDVSPCQCQEIYKLSFDEREFEAKDQSGWCLYGTTTTDLLTVCPGTFLFYSGLILRHFDLCEPCPNIVG